MVGGGRAWWGACAWQGGVACMAGGMHGRGVCVYRACVGGEHGGGICGRGFAWWGAYVAGGVHGGGHAWRGTHA